jgi:hypothetical protein
MIYFIQARLQGGPIKIGFTDCNPKKRLNELQIGNPYTLCIIGCVQGNEADELGWHMELSDHRIGGEWFEPVPAVAGKIAMALEDQYANTLRLKQVHKNWDNEISDRRDNVHCVK